MLLSCRPKEGLGGGGVRRWCLEPANKLLCQRNLIVVHRVPSRQAWALCSQLTAGGTDHVDKMEPAGLIV